MCTIALSYLNLSILICIYNENIDCQQKNKAEKQMKTPSPLKKAPKTVKIDLSSQRKHSPTIIQTPAKKLKYSNVDSNKYSSAKLHKNSKDRHQMTLQTAINSYDSAHVTNHPNNPSRYKINKPPHNSKNKSNDLHSNRSNQSAKFNKQFNQSVEKLKNQLFPNERSQTKARIKTLKAIGQNASERQRQIQYLKRKRLQNEEKLQKQQQQQNPAIRNFNYNIVENKPYFQFEKDHKKYLAERQKARQSQRRTSPKHSHSFNFKTFSFSDETDEQRDELQKSIVQVNLEEPTQPQIQCICQIYVFCSLDAQSDTMTLDDLNKLTQQFQRLYFLKVIQNKSTPKSNIQVNNAQIAFYSLIKQFKNNIKVAFYRKQQNNIYDMIYFLKDAKRLQIVCDQFNKIKDKINM